MIYISQLYIFIANVRLKLLRRIKTFNIISIKETALPALFL